MKVNFNSMQMNFCAKKGKNVVEPPKISRIADYHGIPGSHDNGDVLTFGPEGQKAGGPDFYYYNGVPFPGKLDVYSYAGSNKSGEPDVEYDISPDSPLCNRRGIKREGYADETYDVNPDGTLRLDEKAEKQRNYTFSEIFRRIYDMFVSVDEPVYMRPSTSSMTNPEPVKTAEKDEEVEHPENQGQYGGFFEGWERPDFTDAEINRMKERLNSTNSGSKPSYQDLKFDLPPNSGTEWTANHAMPDADEDGE